MENAANNSEIGLEIHATDRDATSEFNTVTYGIYANVPFTVDPETGKIMVFLVNDQILDYEFKPRFDFSAFATDGKGKQSGKGSKNI